MHGVNTLRDQVEALPDLDEFTGMSITDIAHNIIAWPEDSEEQRRAIMAIQARSPGVGHNRPPLAEQLDIDTEALRATTDALIEQAAKSLIIDEASAIKVNDLRIMLADKEAEVETARKARNKPYADAVGVINATFNGIKGRLEEARIGADQKGGLRQMLTVWDNKKRADAEAARLRAEAEQRAREEEAAEAQRKADAARDTGDQRAAVSADLHAASLADQAERAQVRAQAIRPEPTRSHLGTTSRPRVITFTIDDETKAFAWARSTPGISENLLDDLKTRVGAYLRSIGVKGVERGITIPGITAKTELGAVSSRR